VHLFARTPPFGHQNYAKDVTLHTVTAKREADIHPARLYTNWSEEDFEIFLSNILDVIAVEGLDVLHFHYAVPFAFLAVEVKHRLGLAAPWLVGTLHGTDVSEYGRDPIKGNHLAQALNEVDMLSTVSDSHASLATDVFGLSTRPVVIPNFVDLSIFRPSQPLASLAGRRGEEHIPFPFQESDWRANRHTRPRIAHVSNFRPVKDPQSMARIFLGIREQISAELWLIGDGPEMDVVRTILGQSRFEKDVRYWKLQHDVGSLLAQTDLLLMTSLSESFCLAALEAMACGVPVLSTDVGGLSELVVRGETGYLFPVGEQDLAIDLAVNLLSDKKQYRAMSLAAAHHATNFGIECIVPEYEHLYQRQLGSKSNVSLALSV
jgi:N-acetyl-alpha-D-glucosaminyl L-malate synthase BshA